MARARGEWTLILIGRPGSRAREVKIPRAFPAWVVLFAVMSAFVSLCFGRQARAWVSDEVRAEILALPMRADLATRERSHEIWRAPFAQGLGLSLSQVPDLRRVLYPVAKARAELEPPLRLFDVNAQTSLEVAPFDAHGREREEALASITHFMRCRRTGAERPISRRLIGLLTAISRRFGGPVMHVISAHRSVDGVVTSQTSQHGLGTAADIRIPGVSLTALQRAAYEVHAGGIGLYTKSRFVHVDVRSKPYYWRDDGEGAMAVRIEP